MGNRTPPNIIKYRKQKRMRRAYLKKYSGEIHVPAQHMDKAMVPRGMEGILDYRKRGNTFWENYLDQQSMMLSVPRRVALYKSRLELVNKLNCLTQEVIPEMNVVVHRGGITKTVIRFYFATDFMKCFFMKEDWIDMVMWKSTTYYGSMSRDRAYFDLNANRIEWVDRIQLLSE